MARLRLGIKAVFGMSNLFDLIIRSCQVQSIFVKVGENARSTIYMDHSDIYTYIRPSIVSLIERWMFSVISQKCNLFDFK